MKNKPEILGLYEIAELVGASKQNIHNWRTIDPTFPKPYVVLQCGSIYLRKDIEAWWAPRKKHLDSTKDSRIAKLKAKLAELEK